MLTGHLRNFLKTGPEVDIPFGCLLKLSDFCHERG